MADNDIILDDFMFDRLHTSFNDLSGPVEDLRQRAAMEAFGSVFTFLTSVVCASKFLNIYDSQALGGAIFFATYLSGVVASGFCILSSHAYYKAAQDCERFGCDTLDVK